MLHVCFLAENNNQYSGVVGLVTGIETTSPGIPLTSLPSEPQQSQQHNTVTLSSDPTALTLLQSSNNSSQHYHPSSMLPSFTYSSGLIFIKCLFNRFAVVNYNYCRDIQPRTS